MLLVVVMVVQFGYPITDYGEILTAIYIFGYGLMIVTAVLVARGQGHPVPPIIGVAVLFLVTGTWFSLDQRSELAQGAMLITIALAMGTVILSMMRVVFSRGEERGLDLVLAAVTAYLAMGGLFAAVFGLLEFVEPGAFVDSAVSDSGLPWQRLLYFSYVTMSTLGYGDIVPATSWGRSIASFVAVVGTLYLTVLVARLVGMWSADVGLWGSRGDGDSDKD